MQVLRNHSHWGARRLATESATVREEQLEQTSMEVFGEHRIFAAVNASTASAQPAGLLGGSSQSYELEWGHAARAMPLEVTILGGSVSAGCGALAPLLRCDVALSWTRQLNHWLAHLRVRPWIRAFGKNAITPNFLQCARRSCLCETQPA